MRSLKDLVDAGAIVELPADCLESAAKTLRRVAAYWRSEPACPECGHRMVIREAPVLHRGPEKRRYWGCTQFPRCNRIIHIDR